MRGWISLPLAVAFALMLGACASAGGPAGEAGDVEGIAIMVDNDLVPPASITVYVRPETGSRRRLGALNPSSRQTFSFQPGFVDQEFRLEAEVSGGQTHRSDPFPLAGVQSVSWNVSRANVSVSQ